MKTYVFDIDGTICTKLCELQGNDYADSEPLEQRIEKVNELYDEGNTIIYMTARGMGRHKNNPQAAIEEFYAFTKEQLNDWGCKYHHLFLGKPAAEYYVDDKGVKDEHFFTD
jgi:histidinol phosphatase-like enzyme